jgi:hypothetical protein
MDIGVFNEGDGKAQECFEDEQIDTYNLLLSAIRQWHGELSRVQPVQ